MLLLLSSYIMPSSPVLLYIYYTCFSTFWHCHPYILQHFNENACFTVFFVSRMPYYVSIKAHNSTVQEFCGGQYVRLHGHVGTIPT